MKLTALHVEQVARLAKLNLSSNEKAAALVQLAAILDAVDDLAELPISEGSDSPGPRAMSENRSDAVGPSLSLADVFRNAPQESLGAFVIPRVIE
jgi:aspartyl-tRNA(Asn)/glutamyl-tRNA(Gln) amidotransferase subunit C